MTSVWVLPTVTDLARRLASAGVDPISNLSSYGLVGTFLAIVCVAAVTLWRTNIKSRDEERKAWETQRLDLIARVDQANTRADRAEERVARAMDEMRTLTETTSGRGMETLQRALTAVAESAAREKAAQEEIERLRRDNDRLNDRLDDRTGREIERRRD